MNWLGYHRIQSLYYQQEGNILLSQPFMCGKDKRMKGGTLDLVPFFF